jgi:type I restriction enzyme R subunit
MNKQNEDFRPNDFLNPQAPIRQHRHRLPHWQQGSVYYFVTWRLADSLPKEKLASWSEEKNLWLRKNPPPWDSGTEAEYYEKFSQAIDDWLDAGEGSCLLADPPAAHCVANALRHYDNERYVMDSFVIMPNHVHVLFRLIEPHHLEAVVKSWKGFTSREINRCLQRHGTLWQEDCWDRMIRDESHFLKCRDYIRDNPTKARLECDKFVLFVREVEGGFSNPPLTADKNVRPPR